MTLRAGIYGRNSKGEAKSIEDQIDIGCDVVAQEGWTLAGKYSDDSSASRYRQKDRDEWAQLLADLAAGALDVLVLWKSARGSRDEIDWLLMLRCCRERGILIHVMADRRTYDPRLSRDWKTLAEDGVNSAYYSEELSENVRRGVGKAAAKGGPHGRVAFGYDGRYDEATQRPLRVPNMHAPIVREIFERLARLTPISGLTQDFRARGLPSPSGRWHRNTIRTIATNATYIGKRLYGGDIYDAQWPAIVDEVTYWRVQEILGAPERKTTRPGKAKYLLSYVGAAACGGKLRRNAGKPGAPERYACVEDGCVSIVLAEADAVIDQVIVARLSRPDARELLGRDDAGTARGRADAVRLRAQLEDARKSFERPDGISAEALARKERALQPLIADAEARTRPSSASGVLERVVNAERPAEAWAGLEMAARRELVGSLARVVLGAPTRRLPRLATRQERLAEAWARLGGSSWAGDVRTWAEIRAAG